MKREDRKNGISFKNGIGALMFWPGFQRHGFGYSSHENLFALMDFYFGKNGRNVGKKRDELGLHARLGNYLPNI